jgi:protein-S-isoprenylcysteine O-methyltransferase Ste14
MKIISRNNLQQAGLLVLAIVFSIALMFSFTELPRLLDASLQDGVGFPGLDHGRDSLNAYKAELYIDSLHLRWIGYGSLLLIAVLIIVGFTTRRNGWAWAGAFAIFLPVFGQFALSMFFLAGLGMLRVGWLPFWDIDFRVLDLGNVIYVPYWMLMWVFRQFNYWAQPLLGWLFMGSGAFLFTWGVLEWLRSRFGKNPVATSWIYRISRHPQYLGWIIWSYGLIIYTPLVNQMKKSWGLSSGLPWLLMTMIIIGICMTEEISMKKKYGRAYGDYQDRTPFLFPLPGWLKRIVKFPMRLITGRHRPHKRWQVAAILGLYTLIFMGLSIFWIDLGIKKVFPLGNSGKERAMSEIVRSLNGPMHWRERSEKFRELRAFGTMAVEPMTNFLYSDNAENQENAAMLLGEMGDTTAIRHLYAAMDSPSENARIWVYRSMARLNGRQALPVLIERLSIEEAAFPRSVIYEIMGDLGAAETWEILANGAVSEAEYTRLSAVKAMARIAPDETAPYLIPLLQSEAPWVRSDAAAIANLVCAPETLPYLQELLNDDYFEIRFLAGQAIRKIEEER